MPSLVSATACMPSSALASVRSATATTAEEFSAICFDVCASSSTVAEVWVTAAACSAAPEACSSVAARTSAVRARMSLFTDWALSSSPLRRPSKAMSS